MTRYGKGTAINLTKVTAPDQINVINDNFKKIQTQLMGLKTYLEPIAQAGKEANDRLNMYLGSDPPVSRPQMTDYAQKQITMGPEPPEEPEVGEVWFVTDEEGNVIAIRHWDGSQWVDAVDNEAVAEAIEQAQQEAEIAKQQAQAAVDTANQATQQANEAIQQAQQGFDAAQNALAEAASAQSIATNAIGQAQTAFDNAQSALTKALEALDAADILSQQVDQNTGDISTLFQTASSLGSRITDAEGNISAIQQLADSLSTRITDAEGNISTLTQTAQGLQSSVSNLQGNVSTLTQTANSLNSRLSNVEGDVSELVQTATNLTSRISSAEGNISALQQTDSSLATRIENAEGDISSLTQTVDGLQTQVSNIEGDVSSLTQTANSLQSRISAAEGNISTLTQTANSLTSQISAKADQSWVSSQISQLSNAINLRVEKDKIINQINISTEGILIDGKKIHITGQTTIDNAVIKDAMIESVSASKIEATSLSAISANLGEVTAGIIRGLTIDGVTGTFGSVSVKDGDFLFKDSITGATYSLVPKTNLINDHSFETLQPSGNVGSDDYYSIGDAGEWIKTGNPKLTSNEGSESSNTEAIFGNQAVVVNNANYVETIMSYSRMARGKVHTISLYAKKPQAYTAGIPRVYVYVYNENILTREKNILWSTTLTAGSAPPSDYRPARYTFNFTMPNITSGIDTYTTFAVRVLSANSNWVIIDGVQLVEGTYAGPYDPDNTLFNFINGIIPARRFTVLNELLVYGGVYAYGPSQQIRINETDTGKTWHIEVNAEALRFVETNVAPRMILSSGAASINAGLDVSSDIEFSGAKGRIFTDTGANVGYIQTTGNEYRVTKYKSTTYIPIRASSFPTSSLAENKLDIHVWEESALELIRNATIYEYRTKWEDEQGIFRWRQGLVVGEGYNTPEGVIDGPGVEQYLMNAWSWKAIQELDTEQQSIKEDTEWLKLEIQVLKQQNAAKDQKISELEEKIRQLEAKII